ncbi:MAG: long-chain fatty acid--CoA ligase [Proteobacteria bacterium]|nr:MAG: long-chain fatty acid--CoA ligase [Pseudomonadota bacterium]
MQSTMQDYPLTINSLFEHGASVFSKSEVVTFDGVTTRRASFREVAVRSRRLAAALTRLGVKSGDRVGTFSWNIQEHLEAYFAVPCIGAVLHTLNLRLFPEQIAYIVNHAEDSVVILDASLISILVPIVAKLTSVRHLIIIGDPLVVDSLRESLMRQIPDDNSGPTRSTDAAQQSTRGASAPPTVHRYEELIGKENADFAFPAVDERSAAAMCYTSGTTGNPKGVVYSHRSIYLHSMASATAAAMGLTHRDRALIVPPMFHANAWGIPHTSWWVGADLIFPGRFVQPEPLARLIALEKPTFAGGVPTVWNDLVRHAESHPVDLSSFRLIISGGSAVPKALIERLQKRHGVRLVQIWGMTETGPLAALSHPPHECSIDEDIDWRSKTGRALTGVDLRIVDADKVLPWDGEAIGEIEVRGPWVTGKYYKDDAPEKFHDGWLKTGDVGTVDPSGFVQITDRAKDVIKSGGEWVSSVDLENNLMAHPDVIEAAVIAVPDDRWDERPLACVVLKEGTKSTLTDLRTFLADRVVRWWLPERWAIIHEVPKTSVGKFDKKVLRQRFADGELKVVELEK